VWGCTCRLPPSTHRRFRQGQLLLRGTPVSAPTELGDEPWKMGMGEARYMPVQARTGDYAIFFRRAAVEITFEGTRYLVVPQAAILVLIREPINEDDW
jgi:chaperonin GroES